MNISRPMRIILTVLAFVLILAAGLTLYIFKIKPLETQITTVEESINKEQELIAQYESSGQEPEQEVTDTIDLQKKLPVVENMEHFILMLEEAEVVSGSLIRNATFTKSTVASNDESTTLEEDIEGLEEENQAFNEETTDFSAEEHTEQAEEEQEEEGHPASLEILTANLTIEADNYFEIENFVKEIERFERIVNVESLEFTGFTEITSLDDIPESQVLTYSMIVSTYFYPTLEELKDQAPKYDAEDPGNKDNPLYQLEIPKSWIVKNSLEDEPFEEIEKDGITYRVYTYRVEEGDTLTSIANIFYQNGNGVDLIKSWNRIKTNKIAAGTSLKIPIADVNKKKTEDNDPDTENDSENNDSVDAESKSSETN